MMVASSSPLQGVIKGRTVELDRDSGLPDGARVLIVIPPSREAAIESLRRSCGAWADAGPELDEFLEQVRRDRKLPRPEIDP